MKKIILKPKKTASVRRFHPWIFSGAVASKEGDVRDGDLVQVYSAGGEYLASGHYQNGSICVRILSVQPTEAEQDFWNQRLLAAYQYRRHLKLTDNPKTNCYRLIHAEGDGLPGLIIDIYEHTAVLQCHSIGMHLEREKITRALLEVYGKRLLAVYDKSADTLPRDYAGKAASGYLHGRQQSGIIKENGHHFLVDWEGGQKTGFFIDQRENRMLLTRYAAGQSVLNTFCYSGGFSIYALAAGARRVDSVDVSRPAIELTDQNVALNDHGKERHQSHKAEVLEFLRDTSQQYDLLIVDPPAFAKSIKKRHNAVQAYKRLNALALQKVKPGGLLFTFSCSQVVDTDLFYHTIVAAALETGRPAKVIHRLSQPPDHPVNLFHPEGNYLKGLVVGVG